MPVVFANPLNAKTVGFCKYQSDKVDARVLAHLLRTNLIPERYLPSQEMSEIRSLVHHRLSIVELHTMVKNKFML
jgi:transposase